MINFLNTVLNDVSLIVDIIYDDKKIELWLKRNCQKLNGDILTVYDIIENKEYHLQNHNTVLERVVTHSCGIWNDNYESYNTYLKNNIENIKNNNKWFDARCETVLPYSRIMDNTFENMQICKSGHAKLYLTEMEHMKVFNITDLSGWINNDLSVIHKMCASYYDILNKHGNNIIKKLQIEKQQFTEIDDFESVEEIDIIIDMIQDVIDSKIYDKVLSGDIVYSTIADFINDMKKQWPPILLPVPHHFKVYD
jgi:hypothetical protein